MAELVDALDSKSSVRKDVQVRFLFWAQTLSRFSGQGFLMQKCCELARKSLSVKKPNKARSDLLKGFGYAPLWKSANKVSRQS